MTDTDVKCGLIYLKLQNLRHTGFDFLSDLADVKLLRRIVIAISKHSLSVSVASQGMPLFHGARTEPSSSVCWAVGAETLPSNRPEPELGMAHHLCWESSLGRGLPSSWDPALFPLESCCQLDHYNIPQTAFQYTGTPRCMTRHTSLGHPCCGAWQICIVTSCHPYYRGQGNLAKSDPSLHVSPRF